MVWSVTVGGGEIVILWKIIIMRRKSLSQSLADGSKFVVLAELTGGPNFNPAPIDHFLKDFADAPAQSIPDVFDLVGITCTDNSGGTPNLEPACIHAHLTEKGLLGDLDFIPHLSCKDRNTDAIRSMLTSFRLMESDSLLIITGDKPVNGKGVFEIETVGMLEMVKEINASEYLKVKPDQLEKVFQLNAGAAVSQFKYSHASQMQQYYKMEKKIAAGAKFLITQVGWDWRKCVELMTYLKRNNLDIPVIGNVFLLSSLNPAPRLMHSLNLPGCFVSDELLAKIDSESIDEQLERAAQQVAMYRSIGAAGVDIGSVHDYSMFTHILDRAVEIGDGWEEYKDNLCFAVENGFYLYDEDGNEKTLSKPRKSFSHRNYDFVHRMMLDEEHFGFNALKKTMSFLGARKGKGLAYGAFDAIERVVKPIIFECEACGDCYLAENFGICTMGKCEKGLDNVPCGDATVDGKCGNNLDITCVGELVYNNAAVKSGGIEKWKHTICKPRDHTLDSTCSILNYLFAKDHTRVNPLASIGEAIHASIPAVGTIMKKLYDSRADACSTPSPQFNYVKALIESQAAKDASFIAVNLDVFVSDNSIAADMMAQYVRMIRKYGGGIAPCIDTAYTHIASAGLKAWYDGNASAAAPLLTSVTMENANEFLNLSKDYEFRFVARLFDSDARRCVDVLSTQAAKLFHLATKRYGFDAQDIFFEVDSASLINDIAAVDKRSVTYTAFETIKRIKADRMLRHANCIIRPSLAAMKMPRSVGVLRAYIAEAMQYGLDAAFVDMQRNFGLVEADEKLMALVALFAKINGSSHAAENARSALDEFCEKNAKKPKAKAKPKP